MPSGDEVLAALLRINDRLHAAVEDSVADSQCGFRAGRGYGDLIYCVCQLVDKTIIHHSKIFLLFVDLCKVYDSAQTYMCIAKVRCALLFSGFGAFFL